MNKDKVAAPTEETNGAAPEITPAPTWPADPKIELLEAQNAALAAELEQLRLDLEGEGEQRKLMEAAIGKLTRRGASTLSSTSSVTFEAGKTQELTRPEFEVDGVKYRFKFAKFHLFGESHLASEAANDEALCTRIVQEYPGQVEVVTE